MGEQFFLTDDVIEGFGLTHKGRYLVDENGERLYLILSADGIGGMYVREVTA